MNSLISPIRRSLASLLVYGLVLIAMPRTFAADADPIASARPASQSWLNTIDAGNYEASYAAAGQPLHDIVPVTKWTLVLKSLRPPWGELVSRKESKHLYQPNGIKGLNGECMVIAYDTSFKKLNDAMEVVILINQDGKWVPVGYTAGPKPAANPGDQFLPQQPDTQTTTQTIQPNKPAGK